MPERLEMVRYLTMVLDHERQEQPVRLAAAEIRNDDVGILVQFQRPRRVEVVLPATWLNGRNNSLPLGMCLGGWKLCEMLRDLKRIPDDVAPAVAPPPEVETNDDDRKAGLDFALRMAPHMTMATSKDIVAMADDFARYLAGARPGA